MSTVVFGYFRIDKRRRILDSHDVYMDPIIIHSTGLWADAPGAAVAKLSQLGEDPMAAIHAACKLLPHPNLPITIALIPLFSSNKSA